MGVEFIFGDSFNAQQKSRHNKNMNFLFDGKIHKVYDDIPEGMQLGDIVAKRHGRNFMLCENIGAAAVTVGKLVTAEEAVYDIDGTNEVVIPTANTNKKELHWYLGGSGTATTAAAMIGAQLGVVDGTGAGITRVITGFISYTYTLSGTDYTAYKVKLDEDLDDVGLDATSVIKIIGLDPSVTLYDAGAAHNGLVTVGASACDTSVAQNKYFFVQITGSLVMEVDGGAAVKGSSVRGSDAATNGDGNVELQVETDIVPMLGVAQMAIADGSLGFVKLTGPYHGNI